MDDAWNATAETVADLLRALNKRLGHEKAAAE